ncbi:MAG: hypothetical protein WA840_00485 [Caulobacteraceae bacterium]
MKSLLAFFAMAFCLAAGAGHAQVFDSTLGFGGVSPDIGCIRGALVGSRFPKNVYDARTNERLLINISACTGGYVSAVNEATGANWTVDFSGDGGAHGRDVDGHAWRYDPKTRQFLNLATKATCLKTNPRHVCAEPADR